MSKRTNTNVEFDRRSFLKTTGTLGVASALAGCTGSDGDGDGDAGSGDGDGSDGSGDGGSNEATQTETETASLEERAQEEGVANVVIAISNSGSFFKEQFANDSDLSVSYQFKDFGKTATQLLQEYQADKMSIDMSGTATTGNPLTLLNLADQGVLKQLPSDIFESDQYKAESLMDGKLAQAGFAISLTMLYNEENVSSPPTTLDELFSEQWKGKVGVDVRDSEYVPAARKVFDSEDRVKQFISNLGEWARPFSSHFDMAKAIVRGEIPMGITYIKYTNYDWGGPLAEADIENFPKTGGYPSFFLPANSPHPNAGELCLRYCLEDARWVKYYKEVAGDNVYYTPSEVEEGEVDPSKFFVTYPEVMQELDPDKVEQEWTEWSGLSQ